MKHLRMILIGVGPILCGFIMNWIMNWIMNCLIALPLGFALPLLSAVMIFLWGYVAFRVFDKTERIFGAACKLNGIGTLMLALVLFQELVLGRYWRNLAGTVPQMYFLPALSVSILISNPIFGLFSDVTRFGYVYIFEYVLMFAVSLIGCVKKNRKR